MSHSATSSSSLVPPLDNLEAAIEELSSTPIKSFAEEIAQVEFSKLPDILTDLVCKATTETLKGKAKEETLSKLAVVLAKHMRQSAEMLQEYQHSNATLTSKLRETEESLTQAEQRVEELQLDLSVKDEREKELQQKGAELAYMENRNAELALQLQACKHKLAVGKTSAEELKLAHQVSEGKLAENVVQITELKQELCTTAQRLSEATMRSSELERTREKLEGELNDTKNRLTFLGGANRDGELRIRELDREVRDLTARLKLCDQTYETERQQHSC